jgi:predicted alpha/beta-hydrolase family hydrolase
VTEVPGDRGRAANEGVVQVPGAGAVSSLLVRPAGARLALVLAHGAGAGMRHPFLAAFSIRLASFGVATFRYQFPYMEAGGHRPDAPDVAAATVRAAVEEAGRVMPELPLVAGGKSFGGRMTSTAAAAAPLPGVRGIAFVGFPLHPPKQPGTKRAEHLGRVTVPMLFLQGTRDEFAELPLLEPVVSGLGARATLHLVDGGDHSFAVPKKSGRGPADVLDELARVLSDWAAAL